MDTSDLAKRMKDYEAVSKSKLMKRCPVIVRIDGKAHHTFTRRFKRPYDEIYLKSMQETAKFLCENVQGCVLSYQQSDEISLILVDYETLNISPYFDYEIQKLCSIIASMATMTFNRCFSENVNDHYFELRESGMRTDEAEEQYDIYRNAIEKGALFDCRVFNIPKEDVTNNIYWRQIDAIRNSRQMLGQAYFTQRELQRKSCSQIQEMLKTQKGIDWREMPIEFQRGSCCIKEYYLQKQEDDNSIQRSRWIIDKEIPIFKGDGREYIEKLVLIGE